MLRSFLYFTATSSRLSEVKWTPVYRGTDKSLARPGWKKATATEDFDIHMSYLLS